MAWRVFFCFHYERDIWRANVVRNSWVTQPDRDAAGFWDASLWEHAKRLGDDAVRHLINEGLKNTSVTVVLIGAQTAERRWVKYEITQSYKLGHGLLGIYIHKIEGRHGRTDTRGPTPFNRAYAIDRRVVFISAPVYYWFRDAGYDNVGRWIESAARAAGR